ncbi:MAG: hypothetical protein AB1333_03595, partial [Patescibacteria group bacterium]
GSKIYDSASLTPEILIIVGNALVMTGLLIGSLMIANSLGIAGATTAYSLASKAGKSAKGWAMSKSKTAAIRAGTAPLRSDRGREIANKLQTLGKDSRVGGMFAKILGARKIGEGLNTAIKKGDEEYNKAKGDFGKLSINEQAVKYNTSNDAEKAAIVSNISQEAKAIQKALKDTAGDIAEAHADIATARANGDIKAENSARKRLKTAKAAQTENKKKRVQFSTAIKDLPVNTRDSMATGGYDVPNMYVDDYQMFTETKKRARRYIPTMIDPITGKRKEEYRSGDQKKKE